MEYKTLQPVKVEAGSGSFIFNQFPGGQRKPIRVHYHRPVDLDENAPVVFVMHGYLRNADTYRDSWVRHAEEWQFLLLAPEFSLDAYPVSEHYILGNVVDMETGEFNHPGHWAFARLEQIFDVVSVSTHLYAGSYSIYGHSAGAQFVHRHVLMNPGGRYDVAVAANAGWYTLPNRDFAFPYGFHETAIEDAKIRQSLARNLVILLGEEDIDPDDSRLRNTPEALAQGINRFERGHHFYRQGINRANELDTLFHWQLETVPNAGHRDRQMSESAVRLLMDSDRHKTS